MLKFFKKKKPKKNVFLWRSVLSKMLGLSIGLAAAAYFLAHDPSFSPYLAAGIVLWFTLQGGVIALMGLVTRHPLWQNWQISAWQRGLGIGVFMHVILALFLYDALAWESLIPVWIEPLWLRDPLVLMMIEGAILGILWDSLITAATGEGKALAKSL